MLTYAEGPFLGGHRTGLAKITFPDGDVYEGAVENGKAYGTGILMYADGQTTFKGEFRGGKKHGAGTIITIVGGETIVTEGVWNRGHMLDQDTT